MSVLDALLAPQWLEEEQDISLSRIPQEICKIILFYDRTLFSIKNSHPSVQEMEELAKFMETVLGRRCQACDTRGFGNITVYNNAIECSVFRHGFPPDCLKVVRLIDDRLLGIRSIFEIVKHRCDKVHLSIHTAHSTTLKIFDSVYSALINQYLLSVTVTYLRMCSTEIGLDISSLERKMKTPHRTQQMIQEDVKKFYETVRKEFAAII